MPGAWTGHIAHVVDGSPVNAGNTSRPTQELERNVQLLKEVIDNAALGRFIVDSAAALAPGIVVGNAVYYDAVNARYALAKAEIGRDAATGELVAKPSSRVVGIVQSKNGPVVGDVVLYGYIKVDLSNAVTGSVTAGPYYLSATTAGELVKREPPISIFVGDVDGDGGMFVRPDARDPLAAHRHYSLPLVCRPAGTTSEPDVGDRHVIGAADTSISGWLPANDASFNGLAPVGAAFGYNLASDASLRRLFPPLPIQSAMLIWDRGVGYVGGTVVPLGLNGLAVVDSNGIWWMSDAYGDVPWPVTYNSSSPPDGVPANSSLGPEAPRLEEMRLTLLFAPLVGVTAETTVTSLKSDTASPIQFLGPDGKPATTGPLTAIFDLPMLVDTDTVAGNDVFKGYTNGVFSHGPVVGRIKAGAGILLSSSDPGVDADGWHRGNVLVSANAASAALALEPSIEALSSAQQRTAHGLSCLGFPAGRDGAVRAQFLIPPIGLPPSPKLVLRLGLAGTVAGTLPDLTVTYMSLARPASGGSTSLTLSPTSVTVSTAVTVTTTDMIEIVATGFTVVPGLVAVTITRSSSDGYAGEVQLYWVLGELVAG